MLLVHFLLQRGDLKTTQAVTEAMRDIFLSVDRLQFRERMLLPTVGRARYPRLLLVIPRRFPML
jgi:hypothetical protein